MTHSSIIRILESAFGSGIFTRDKKNFQVSCPSCSNKKSGKKKLHIKLDDLRYHCWVCGLKGKNALYLAAKTRPDLNIDPKQTKKRSYQNFDDEVKEEKVVLPQGLVPVYRPSKDPDIKSVKKYLISRGVTLQKMARWRIMASKRCSSLLVRMNSISERMIKHKTTHSAALKILRAITSSTKPCEICLFPVQKVNNLISKSTKPC